MWYKDSMKRKNENGIVDRETGWFTTLAASGNQDPWKKELHPGLMSVRITGRSGMMDNFNSRCASGGGGSCAGFDTSTSSVQSSV